MHRNRFDELREVLSGELIVPGDPAYDEARAVFNAMINFDHLDAGSAVIASK